MKMEPLQINTTSSTLSEGCSAAWWIRENWAMKFDNSVTLVVLFGTATGVLPFGVKTNSDWKRRKFYSRLVKIYAIFMLINNAASNLDVHLNLPCWGNVNLATKLYTTAIYIVSYLADFWIRFYMLAHQRRIAALLRRLNSIQSYTSNIHLRSSECSNDRRCRWMLGAAVINYTHCHSPFSGNP